MPGNDFEKQVQQKMDELQFAPSDAVWPAVERQIAGRKKRRILFIWLPLLFLLMGSVAWLYNSNIGKEKNKIAVTADAPGAINNIKKTDTTTTTNLSATTTHTSTKVLPAATTVTTAHKPAKEPSFHKDKAISSHSFNKTIVMNGDAKGSTRTKNKLTAIVSTPQTEAVIAAVGNSKKSRKKYTPSIAGVADHANDNYNEPGVSQSNKKPTAGKVNQNKAVITEAVIIEDVAAQIPKTHQKNSEQVGKENNNDAIIQATADSVVEATAVDAVKKGIQETVKNNNKADSFKSVVHNKTPAAKKTIEWGINVTAGASTVFNGADGLSSGSLNFLSPPGSSLNNSTSGSSNPTGAGAASATKAGFSYAAGVFVGKPLGKNFKLLAGLNYSYYSNHITIGTKIDSISGTLQYQADRSRGAAGYTNQFHFIELPVTIEKQLGKNSRVSLNAGISISFLAGTNALVYDAQKANYTTDKSYITKMQLGVLAGFNYRLFPKMHPVEIGPQFNYNLSSIFKKELYGSRHLFFYGVNAKFFLHKNKQ